MMIVVVGVDQYVRSERWSASSRAHTAEKLARECNLA